MNTLQYHSVSFLARQAEAENTTISRIVLRDQAAHLEVTEEEVLERMRGMLRVMAASAAAGADPDIRSSSGLTGGDGYRMLRHLQSGAAVSGPFCAMAIGKAISVSECNAAMGKIVAAPTAGSCGILPGVVLTALETGLTDEDGAVMALITAGALGLVIAGEASIAGAEGGCQAECGSAAAMAAAALCEMAGAPPAAAENACAIALKNQLGLVCDPVAGLVEVPCIKRNAGGVMCAVGAAEMALAGIVSVIPVDEVISALREIGDAMAAAYKETAQGGLAATPTGKAIQKRIFGTDSGSPGGSCGGCSRS